jgi:hypothetical protein
MKEVRSEIEIQASPEKVWQILTDFDSWSEWNPFLYRASGTAGLGEQVDISFQGPGSKETSLCCTIQTLEQGRQWMWSFHAIAPFLFRGEHSFAIEPVDGDHVRFVQREVFKGLLVPFLVKEADTLLGYRAMDEALKNRAEQGGG